MRRGLIIVPYTTACTTRFFSFGDCIHYNNELWLNFPSSTHTGQCVQSTYPEDFEVLCFVVERKWAFNPNSSRCEGISYSPCGQEREGYNVFDTEAECNRTCVMAEGNQGVIDINLLLSMYMYTCSYCDNFAYYIA